MELFHKEEVVDVYMHTYSSVQNFLNFHTAGMDRTVPEHFQ